MVVVIVTKMTLDEAVALIEGVDVETDEVDVRAPNELLLVVLDDPYPIGENEFVVELTLLLETAMKDCELVLAEMDEIIVDTAEADDVAV